MSKQHKKEKAVRLYAFLLKCYPQGYRHLFSSQMIQTFKDHYTDIVERDAHAETRFWFGVVSDEVRGIMREQFTTWQEEKYMKDSWIKQGILFGVIAGIMLIAYDFINNLAPTNVSLNQLLGNGFLLGVLIFPCIAGYITAQKTGEVKTGTYAGLFTGLLSIAIGMGALFVITFVFIDAIRQNAFMLYDFHRSGLKSIDEFIIQDTIGAAVIGTVFSLLAGGISGTVGGYLGRILKARE